MEQWRDIEGYEGIYQVSDLGRVRRVRKRYDSVDPKPEIRRVVKLKPAGTGYRAVCLCWHGQHDYRNVHRLVARAFIPNPDDLPEVNHINGDKTDNRLVNLEWVTRGQNHRHAIRIGLQGRGETASGAKLTRDQALAIRALASTGQYTFAELGTQFGIDSGTVGNLLRGETWAHLGPPVTVRKRRTGSAKITAPQAIRIRSLYATGEYTMAQVGEQFGLKKSQVGNIVNGRCWYDPPREEALR